MATVTTRSDTSVVELKSMINSAEPQELEFGDDKEDADGTLLHLIRTIALYLFVFLSQTVKLAMTDVELAVFVSESATPDVLDAQTAALQRRLHVALFAWVQREVNTNQFDGLLQEQRVFVVIKRLFRQQRTKAVVQCRVLTALLTAYLTRLGTPLVRCEPVSMLSSTLEYLLAKEKNSDNQEPVPLSTLYPLVNAVDLVGIEQRECLDALINLLRWLSAPDQSQKVFAAFASKYHAKIIGMTSNTLATDAMSAIDSDNSNTNTSDALGVCFVQMLLRYSDHIFRRDLQFEDIVPTLSYSDTEDDDVSSEDAEARSRQQSSHDMNDIPDNLSAADFDKPTDAKSFDMNRNDNEPTTISQELPELEHEGDKKHEVLVLKASVGVAKKDKAALSSKVASRSLRKRKKREEKAMAIPVKTTRRAKSIHEVEYEDTHLISKEWADEEPLPAVVCVGIAAAAGTLAAVLCVFFN